MINHNDPRLTAYLLGELDEDGHEEIQSALAQSPELRKHVDALRETIESVQNALGGLEAGADELTADQIAAVEAAAAETPVTLGESPRRVMWRRLAMAALVFYAVGISLFAFQPTRPLSVAENRALLTEEPPGNELWGADEADSSDESQGAGFIGAGFTAGRPGADGGGRPEGTEIAVGTEFGTGGDRGRRYTDGAVDGWTVQDMPDHYLGYEAEEAAESNATGDLEVSGVIRSPGMPSEPAAAIVPESLSENEPAAPTRLSTEVEFVQPMQADDFMVAEGLAEIEMRSGDATAERGARITVGRNAGRASGQEIRDSLERIIEPESRSSERSEEWFGRSKFAAPSFATPSSSGMNFNSSASGGQGQFSEPGSPGQTAGAFEGQVSRATRNIQLAAPKLPEIDMAASDPFGEAPADRRWDRESADADLDHARSTEMFGLTPRIQIDEEAEEALGLPMSEPASDSAGSDLAASDPAASDPAKSDSLASDLATVDAVEMEVLEEKQRELDEPSPNLVNRERKERDEVKAKPKTWKPASASTNRARLSIGHHDDLLLAARDTYVRIDGFRARVMFDLYYYNDRGRQLEGQFMLRLPDDASLHYFAFGATNLPTPQPEASRRASGKPGEDVEAEPFDPSAAAVASLRKRIESNGSDLARRAADANYKAQSNSTFGAVKTAYVAPRQKAAMAYEETVRRRVDPALVEWAGPGIFQTKVFPLMPGKLHRIVVGYDVTLSDVENDRMFKLDLPEDEAGGRVEFDIVAAGGTGAVLDPPTDPFVSGGRAYYRYEGAAPRDYTARITGTGAVAIRHTDPLGGQYFATRAIAELPKQEAKIDTRQAVFLLDTSWSDRPDAFARRLQLLDQILSSNRDAIDEFAVMIFNVHQHWWKREFVVNNDDNVRALMEFANRLALEGATDLRGALAEATSPEWDLGQDEILPEPNFFLLSDAVATWGATEFGDVAEPLSELQRDVGGGALFAYPFAGLPSDRTMMQVLADASGGAVFNVGGKEQIAEASVAHRSRPWRLVDAKATGAEEVLVQGGTGAVYPGQPLMIVGRGELGGPIELEFERGKETRSISIETSLAIRSPAAARLYGGLAVEQLDPFQEGMEEIKVAFARYFRVPGRTCSMVMLESKEDYQRFGVSLSPEEDHLVVASSDITSLVASEQSKQMRLRSHSRQRFLDWVESLQSASLVNVPTALRLAIGRMPESAFSFAPNKLNCRSFQRDEHGQAYLDELAAEQPDFNAVMLEADEVLISLGADDAIKTASTMVEAKPSDVETLRSVAFRAIQWKRGDQAAPLLWRITQARPYQPQCLMLLARSLAEAGDLDAAVVCLDLVTRGNWNQRWSSSKEIAKVELVSLLGQIDSSRSAIGGYAKARLQQLRRELNGEGWDVAVLMHWNTDRTDVDLHVTQPDGEVCFYKNRSTKAGGRMTADITEGLGPELYTLPSAEQGKYHVQAKYFRSDQNRTKAPTEILVTLFRDLGRPEMQRQTKRMTLSGQSDRETVLRFEVRNAGRDSE